MNTKMIMYIAISINIILGNLILSFFHGKYETINGKIAFHSTTSIVALLMLIFLFNKSRKKTEMWKIIAMSFLGAFSVPVLSIYFLFAGFGIYQMEFDSLIKAIPVAVISGIVSWFFWIPLGLMNSLFILNYSKHYDNKIIKLTSGSTADRD